MVDLVHLCAFCFFLADPFHNLVFSPFLFFYFKPDARGFRGPVNRMAFLYLGTFLKDQLARGCFAFSKLKRRFSPIAPSCPLLHWFTSRTSL